MHKDEIAPEFKGKFVKYSQRVFDLRVPLCLCSRETEYDENGMPVEFINMRRKPDEYINYVYITTKGLIMLDDGGHILDRRNVIGDIIEMMESIISLLGNNPESNLYYNLEIDQKSKIIADKLCKFISIYGYPFGFDGEKKISLESINPLFHFYSIFILENELSRDNPDLSIIIENLRNAISTDASMFYYRNDYLIVPIKELKTRCYSKESIREYIKSYTENMVTKIKDEEINQYKHPIKRYFLDHEEIRFEHSSLYRNDAILSKYGMSYYTYQNTDSYTGEKFKFDAPPSIEFIGDQPIVRSGSSFEEPEFPKQGSLYYYICKLHREISDTVPSVKYLADLWYNILKGSELSEEELSDNKTLKSYLSTFVKTKLKHDKKAKGFIVKIAKQVCKDELDHILEGGHPLVALEHKNTSWNIKDLYTALYFALYWFDTEKQHYIRCSREKCHRYFLTSKNENKKAANAYCSAKCASAESSRLSRERKKAAGSAGTETRSEDSTA